MVVLLLPAAADIRREHPVFGTAEDATVVDQGGTDPPALGVSMIRMVRVLVLQHWESVCLPHYS